MVEFLGGPPKLTCWVQVHSQTRQNWFSALNVCNVNKNHPHNVSFEQPTQKKNIPPTTVRCMRPDSSHPRWRLVGSRRGALSTTRGVQPSLAQVRHVLQGRARARCMMGELQQSPAAASTEDRPQLIVIFHGRHSPKIPGKWGGLMTSKTQRFSTRIDWGVAAG